MESVTHDRCLVLGASGTVGRYLLARLAPSGRPLLAVSRRPPINGDANIDWLQGDLYGDMPELSDAGVGLIFSVGPLDGFARFLCQSNLPNLRRIVALSSMSVECKAQSGDRAERDLADLLQQSEEQVITFCRQRDIQCVLLRPTLIYGGGSDRSLALLARTGSRWRLFPSIPAAIGLRQPIHADDVAAACVAASSISISSVPSIIRLGGGEQLTFAQMLSRTRKSLPVTTLPVPIPLYLARTLVRTLKDFPRWQHLDVGLIDRLLIDQIVDNGEATRQLGVQPREFEPDGGRVS